MVSKKEYEYYHEKGYQEGYSDAHDDLMVQVKEDLELVEQELDDMFDNYGTDENVTKETQYVRMNQLIGQKRVWDLMRLYLTINNDTKRGCSINSHLRSYSIRHSEGME